MDVAIALIGIIAAVVALIMFILALLTRSGWGIVKSTALGILGVSLIIMGPYIGGAFKKPTPITTPAGVPETITPAGIPEIITPVEVPETITPEPNPPVPVFSPAPITVTTLDIGWPMPVNWDADADIDGIEFQLQPKDAKDKMVETPCVVSAKLWFRQSLLEGGGKGDLIQEWSNIQITEDDYDWWGATIRLEYMGFKPEEFDYGILEVTIITPDGKEFADQADSVLLAD